LLKVARFGAAWAGSGYVVVWRMESLTGPTYIRVVYKVSEGQRAA
jgi:hypothetical protein